MKNVYVVIEHYGDFGDDCVVAAVCNTQEQAEKHKEISEKHHSSSITRDQWDAYCLEVDEWEENHPNEEHFDSWTEGINYLHPELDYDTLARAEMIHCEDDYLFTEIKTAPFFN